jgi:hypothetical protein
MSIKRVAAAGVVASLLVGFVPATAWAGDDSIVSTKAPAPSKLMSTLDLRSATARAVESAINAQQQIIERQQILAPPMDKKSNRRNAAASGGASGGGGGGTAMMVIGLVASLGATYFIYKEMTKTTDQIAKSSSQSQGFLIR